MLPQGPVDLSWGSLVDAMGEQRGSDGAALTYGGDMVDITHEQTARASFRWPKGRAC